MWTSGALRKLLLALLVTAAALAAPPPPRARAAAADGVVVVGAGPGAGGAAVQARRAGARVGLFPQSDWLGGQASAAGVSTMDESYRWTSPPTSIEGPSG